MTSRQTVAGDVTTTSERTWLDVFLLRSMLSMFLLISSKSESSSSVSSSSVDSTSFDASSLQQQQQRNARHVIRHHKTATHARQITMQTNNIKPNKVRPR